MLENVSLRVKWSNYFSMKFAILGWLYAHVSKQLHTNRRYSTGVAWVFICDVQGNAPYQNNSESPHMVVIESP